MKAISFFRVKYRTFIPSALLLLFFLFNTQIVFGQIFWTETFSNGCATNCPASTYVGGNGAWTVTATGPNDPFANKWFVSGAECGNAAGVCGTGCGTTDPSLHIANVAGSPLSGFSCPGGDCGAAYDAGLSSNQVTANTRAESPTIDCSGFSTITLAFNYIEEGDPPFDDASVFYYDGAVWALLTNTPATANGACGGQGFWTAFSIALPVSANNNPNVRIGFLWVNNDDFGGADPSFAVDDVTLSTPAPSNTITTGSIFSAGYCQCDTVNIPFTSTGTYNAGNIYTAQMSNSAGSFAVPTILAPTFPSTANSGIMNCTIPCGTPAGAGYRFRVVSDNPATTGTDNGVNISVNASVAAAISISAAPGTNICGGASVTLTAVNTNSIPSPSYQWSLNAIPIGGATSSTYTSTGFINGDQLTCEISSVSGCVTGSPATSNTVTFTVSGTAIVAADTIVVDQNPICTGTLVNFTATNTNGIPSPSYQWKLNGVNIVGATLSTYFSNTLANGDIITCVISSSDPCVTGSPATSNSIIMTVSNSLVASVSIAVSPNDTICAGDVVTFTATPLNGGTTPVYSWTVNAAFVGAGATYVSGALADGDIVACTLTSSMPCVAATATSTVTITVEAGGFTTVTISAPSDTACPGQTITFTAVATNAGFAPVYQWFLNGAPVGSNNPIYLNGTLNNGDVITCQVTSSSGCSTGSPALSNAMTMVVTNTLTAAITISTINDTVCAGDPLTFWAAATNGGLTPIYTWLLNSNTVGTNSETFTSNTFVNGDQLICVLISSDPCAFSGIPVSSNIVTIVVNECPVPVSKFVASKTVICQNDCVNFTDMSDNAPIGWHWYFEGANPAETYDQNPVNICYPTPGVFSVRLLSNNLRGFHDSTVVAYIEVEDPTAVINAGEDQEIQIGTSTEINVTGGNAYFWTPGTGLSCADCKNPIASPSFTTTYIVSDTLGCPSSDTVTIKVFNDFEIYVPNAFSPNGDGQNDVLYVRGNGIKEVYMVIYDRIGEKVYVSSSNKDAGWDGNFRGKHLNPGVFSFFVKAYMIDGSTKTEKGNVTLFR